MCGRFLTASLLLLLLLGSTAPAQAQGTGGAFESSPRAYRHLLLSLGDALSAAEQKVAARHVAQLALILPERVRDQILVGDWEARREDPAQWTFSPEASEVLLRWWRSQDPLSATLEFSVATHRLRRW